MGPDDLSGDALRLIKSLVGVLTKHDLMHHLTSKDLGDALLLAACSDDPLQPPMQMLRIMRDILYKHKFNYYLSKKPLPDHRFCKDIKLLSQLGPDGLKYPTELVVSTCKIDSPSEITWLNRARRTDRLFVECISELAPTDGLQLKVLADGLWVMTGDWSPYQEALITLQVSRKELLLTSWDINNYCHEHEIPVHSENERYYAGSKMRTLQLGMNNAKSHWFPKSLCFLQTLVRCIVYGQVVRHAANGRLPPELIRMICDRFSDRSVLLDPLSLFDRPGAVRARSILDEVCTVDDMVPREKYGGTTWWESLEISDESDEAL